MSLVLCLASQPGTSVLKREVDFLCTGQVTKAESKLLHELLVCPTPCPRRQDWHLSIQRDD